MRRARVVLVVLALSAGWVPAAGAGILPPLPPLPLPLPLPPLPASPLPSSGSGGSAAGTPATQPPPRPSRSPPSSCADQSVPGVIPFALAVFPCDFPDPMVLRAGDAW